MKFKYYVYHLIDPRTNLPRYVGKGSGERISYHTQLVISGEKHYNPKLHNWISKLFWLGLKPIEFKVFEIDDEHSAFEMEKEEISRIGIENLCNLHEGGRGGRVSDESIEKIRKSLIGREFSEDHRKRLSASALGNTNGIGNKSRTGFKNSKEHNFKIGTSSKGRLAWNKGKKRSEEVKKKISDGMRKHKLLQKGLE